MREHTLYWHAVHHSINPVSFVCKSHHNWSNKPSDEERDGNRDDEVRDEKIDLDVLVALRDMKYLQRYEASARRVRVLESHLVGLHPLT